MDGLIKKVPIVFTLNQVRQKLIFIINLQLNKINLPLNNIYLDTLHVISLNLMIVKKSRHIYVSKICV